MRESTNHGMPAARIAEILRREDDFLIASHYNPDGDAIGSMAALAHMLRRMGKQVMLYNESGVPDQFGWLDMGAPCVTALDEIDSFAPRRLVVLDCGDDRRPGQEIRSLLSSVPSINIDHHLGNPQFADVNWVDSSCAATGEMVALIGRELGAVPDGPVGEALYLALVSDTGSFSYGNTTAQVLEIAADILRCGLDLGDFGPKMQNNWSLNRMQLWGRLMGAVRLSADGRIAALGISSAVLEETGTTIADAEGIINYMRRIRGVQVAVTVREHGPGRSKASLRSNGTADVQRVAAGFGGGGHRNAAGAELDMPLESAVQEILSSVSRNLALDAEGA
ncbi:phosphoesterase RecJ domain protein [Oleidesulfovibrio alaskensis G20]|jgi:phosphoesterase RecJ-like protein|uniref:Phosphoesterase RecJ domain protein n=1 Tax=Oleidesulfovibrio alaskensis (strain ATCC BAA-1058 / DSM 17464 / G20) TaxID=207559 RepID=Q30WI8_OLEA2|nr:bifunctional oligoribonuclease/PAP phosphatase NrnA [Oleidesulfovibrio alaskensis]ABB39958.1 phosphoesterase RecJ domain protein [Oleidesulfovibrio alaskensis G20]